MSMSMITPQSPHLYFVIPSSLSYNYNVIHILKNLNIHIMIGYTNVIETNNGETTLVFDSKNIQHLTGLNTHTVILPETSTLTVGQHFTIINTSTQYVTVKSSGLNTVCILNTYNNNTVKVVCTSTSGTTASSWDYSVYTNSTASYFAAYNDGVIPIDIDTTWTDVGWTLTDTTDTNFIFTPGSSSMMVGRSGDYEIQVDLNFFVTSGSGNTKTQVEIRVVKNGTYLPGTKSLVNLQDVGIGSSATLKLIKPLVANDVLKIQCIRQGANRGVRLYPDGCRVQLQRLGK